MNMKIPPKYEADYIAAYDTSNGPKTFAGQFLFQGHRLLEKTCPKKEFRTILEVGAGTGHHMEHVKGGFEKYFLTDANPAMLKLLDERRCRLFSGVNSVQVLKEDATNLSFKDDSVDRLIATHVLEHLTNPVDVMREWVRVVRPGGIISLILPCDPGLLWRLGRHMGPRARAKRLGIEYDYLMASEHVNAIFNLKVFIDFHFPIRRDLWFPLFLPIPDLNLFYITHLEV